MTRTAIAIGVLLGLGLCACTSSGGAPTSPTPTTSPAAPTSAPRSPAPSKPTPTPAATPSFDPSVKPAVDAYLGFDAAANKAEQHPASAEGRRAVAAYAIDQAAAEESAYLASLAQQGVAMKGAFFTPRISVLKADLAGKPYPTVTLSDCPIPSPDLQEYIVATGKIVPALPAKPPLPHLLTIDVVKYNGKWLVKSTALDRTATCTF